MTLPAILLMVVTILLVWGGLVASVVALHTLPVPGESADTPEAATSIVLAEADDAVALYTPCSSTGKE